MKCYKPIGSRLTVSHLPHTHSQKSFMQFLCPQFKKFYSFYVSVKHLIIYWWVCSNSLFDLFQCDLKREMAATSCLCSLFKEPV